MKKPSYGLDDASRKNKEWELHGAVMMLMDDFIIASKDDFLEKEELCEKNPLV